jgi:hypothetical protein
MGMSQPHHAYLLRFPPGLWERLVLQRQLTAIGPEDTMQKMLVTWIERAMRREEQEID